MSDHTIVIIWVVKIFFVQFFCVFLPSLLNIFCFCFVHTISVLYRPIFTWNVPLISLIFLKRSLVFPILLFSSISLHDHWGRPSYLSLLFFGTLHSNRYIFPFLLCLLLLFFSQLFVRPSWAQWPRQGPVTEMVRVPRCQNLCSFHSFMVHFLKFLITW